MPFGLHLPFKMEVHVGSISLWVPFTLRDGSAHRVHLPFELESTRRVNLPFRLESNRWIHLPFNMEMPFEFTFQVPFTLQDGSTRQVHLPFGMEVPVRSIYPSS